MHPDSSRYTRGRRSEATSQTYQINHPTQNRASQTLQARKHQNPTQTRRPEEEEASVNLRRETPSPQTRQPEDLWLRSCSRLRPACVSASKPVGQQGRHYAGIAHLRKNRPPPGVSRSDTKGGSPYPGRLSNRHRSWCGFDTLNRSGGGAPTLPPRRRRSA